MDIRKFFPAKGDTTKLQDKAKKKSAENVSSPIMKRGAAHEASTPPRTSPRKAAGIATSKHAKPAAVRSLPVSTAEVPSRRSTTAQGSAVRTGVAAPASSRAPPSASPTPGAPANEEMEETSGLSDYEKVINWQIMLAQFTSHTADVHLCRSYCDNQCANKAHVRCTVLLLDNNSTVWCASLLLPAPPRARHVLPTYEPTSNDSPSWGSPMYHRSDQSKTSRRRPVRRPSAKQRCHCHPSAGASERGERNQTILGRRYAHAAIHFLLRCMPTHIAVSQTCHYCRHSQFSRSSRPPTQRCELLLCVLCSLAPE